MVTTEKLKLSPEVKVIEMPDRIYGYADAFGIVGAKNNSEVGVVHVQFARDIVLALGTDSGSPEMIRQLFATITLPMKTAEGLAKAILANVQAEKEEKGIEPSAGA